MALTGAEFGTPITPGDCIQVWASTIKDVTPEGCTAVKRRINLSKNKQFWLGASGTYRIERDSNLIAVCSTTAETCPFTLPQGDDEGDYTGYTSFSYRTNHLTVRND